MAEEKDWIDKNINALAIGAILGIIFTGVFWIWDIQSGRDIAIEAEEIEWGDLIITYTNGHQTTITNVNTENLITISEAWRDEAFITITTEGFQGKNIVRIRSSDISSVRLQIK